MRGLYVHIPFCTCKCAYCDFLSFGGSTAEEISRYLRCLTGEMALAGEDPQRAGEGFSTVYIGGGTPTSLAHGELEGVLRAVRRFFEIEGGAEFTVEANPESLSKSHLRLFETWGVNRISLGVQSFDDRALAAAGRAAGNKDILRALDAIRHAGFENIGIDLIQGIQGGEVFRDDLESAVEAAPSHISVYMLTLSEHTRLSKMARSGAFCTPGDEESEELFVHTGEFLAGHGYRQYEISNYARTGYESRHNAHYWSGGDYRGLGLGAVSTIGAERTTNASALDAYCRMIEGGEAPVQGVETLSAGLKTLERIMLALRTSGGVGRDELERIAGGLRRQALHRFFTLLESNGYSLPDEGRLVLTRKGLFRSNVVVAELWDALGGVF
jgi:oxygen-independent coproporphyrinogen-3 oxidase